MISYFKNANQRNRCDRRASGARRSRARRLAVEPLENRLVLATSYIATDLVSDQPGVAPITDTTLHNAWGIALNPTGGNFWVSSEGGGISDVYSGDVGGSALAKVPLEVTIPGGSPTGQVFNSTSDFVVSSGGASGPSVFIFASNSGSVSGWNPNVPAAGSTAAQLGFQAPDGADYTGIALASSGGANFLYATDFFNGKVDVLNSTFQKTTLAGSFTDPNLPAAYAPFNIALINGQLYVSYAPRATGTADEIAGQGNGLIDVFNTNGTFAKRLISSGKLNDPWGMVVAPANFGNFSNDLLVGNVGSGQILAYNATTGAFQGTLSTSPGHPIVVEELWGLTFGNGVTAGDTNTLYYAGGPDDEVHGVFGKITANAAGTPTVHAVLNGDVLAITGSRDNDRVEVTLNNGHKTQTIVVQANGQKIGSFSGQAVGTIEFQGLAGNDTIHISPRITATAILDGGADNDSLFAGGGPSILLGGTGMDHLVGGHARDIFIGGADSDRISGHQNDDLLIGGSTAYDGNIAALQQILAEWNSTDSFNVRVDKLTNGTGGLPALNTPTVIDDGVLDHLLGGRGLDWIFTEPVV
jgi:uncharacterized protein (TIGR03118 family)